MPAKWEFSKNVAPPDASDDVKGLWNVYEDDMGKSSYREHTLKTVWQSCKPDDHYFELTNSPKRECTCKKCGFITTFVLGIQMLKDGQIINLR